MTDRTRRRLLLAAGGTFAGSALPLRLDAQQPARSLAPQLVDAMRGFTGTARVFPGRVTLDLPPLIENGHGVPLSVSVESPMTAADHVAEIRIFNEKNPQPDIIGFRLGPRAGRARVSTRVRLADTQTVVAVARMSDGSFWSGSAHVIVTLAACLEELAP